MRVLHRVAIFGLAVALATPAIVSAQGQDTYKAKCAMCHGADGGGNKAMGTMPLGGAEVQGMSDAQLTALITNGKGKMPAYKGKLTDAQISDLVSYIRSLKK
jgi:cytochrome c6